tara:strand:+ start:20938 stop:22152 length:1215 start_codon:yes stop_codon:yes gene_type:complete
MDTDPESRQPLVASVCGTFLKPEMQSIYRQIVGLKRFRTIVFTEEHKNPEQFPFEPVEVMTKLLRPKPRGNFALRFYYKYVVKQWPPPVRIEKDVKPYYPFDLLPRLDAHRPDLIHVYYGHKAVTYRNILLKTKIPFVVSFHGVDVAHFAKGDRTEEFESVLDRAQIVLARSESLLDELANLGVPREKLRSNRTPIPLEGIAPKVRRAPEDGAWRLVQACRLIPKKGILTAIEALKPVVERWPNLKYILCGTGPQEDEIRQAAREAGLEANVELRGWMDQTQLRAEFERAHVFLHPSELTASSDQEGVPNSMLEAMAAGLPVVATLHGGIPEAVENEVDGVLVPEKSPRELGDAISRLLGSPDLLESWSRQARESVVKKYGEAQSIAALEDAYADAIERSKHQS